MNEEIMKAFANCIEKIKSNLSGELKKKLGSRNVSTLY